MFALRTQVCCSNALLASFPAHSRVSLSLVNNLAGFFVTLLSLVVLRSRADEGSVIALVNGCAIAAMLFGLLSFGSPTDEPAAADEDIPPFFAALGASLRLAVETLSRLTSERRLRACWLFLLAYLLFAPSGTVLTLYLSTIFMSSFDYTTDELLGLQINYYIAMVTGVLLGLLFDRLLAGNRRSSTGLRAATRTDVALLVAQLLVTGGSLLLMARAVRMELEGPAVVLAMVLGLCYSWSASVARGVMARLLSGVSALRCSIMGLYSSFTYLGIAALSTLNLFFPDSVEAVLLGTFVSLVGSLYVLVVMLWRHL
eukprot:gnl/Ergobibamus_cyprinoides/1759.p1 GENE.gnl/Ergobibamus_cyprinoides/1759~~gnl/Ergobibamus_cyprinoides/1759.p1  ORF type:complete len:314 (+),score=67.59 gnl/Ergobibamus_cyprinoides/1759:316-1257(+)